jgi:hypothetical protein
VKEPRREMGDSMLIIPVIVTNASIYTTRYDPRSVSLDTGEFTTPPDDVTQPQCVRFHKTFPSDSSQDLGARTVFVVTADAFGQFLEGIESPPLQLQKTDEQRNRVFLRRSSQPRF